MNALAPGARLVAWIVREDGAGSIWSRAGKALVNRDGSIGIELDVLPVSGRVHLRVKDEGEPTLAMCPSCSHSNARLDAKFCGWCGKPLDQAGGLSDG